MKLRHSLLIALAASALPALAHASVLRVTPVSPSACANGTFAIEVKLDTEGEAINATTLRMNFSASSLQVTDLSVSGSIFRFWAEGPEYSNSAGTILMTGGLPTPGFTGSNGHVARITLRPTGSGGTLTFSPSTLVLLNDGYGTATDLAFVDMGTLTVLPATDPTCAAPTPAPTATPGLPGTPGPTPTPLVCPEVEACHLPGSGGAIDRMRECEVRVECLAAPSRITKVLLNADDPTACPIVARCAEDTVSEGVLIDAGKVIVNFIEHPAAVIEAVRRGQFWAGMASGWLFLLIVYCVTLLIRKIRRKYRESRQAPPPTPK